MKASSILDGLIYQRGWFKNISKEKKLEMLEEYGISVVVNLTRQTDRDLKRRLGSAYLQFPIADGKHVDMAVPELAAKQALKIRRKVGGAILVHCQGGKNRSGLVSALLLMLMTGCSGKGAVLVVQRRRKNALNNEHFRRYLFGLKGRRT